MASLYIPHTVIGIPPARSVRRKSFSLHGSTEQLDATRQAFRRLNRALRAAGFTVVVDFADE